MILEKVECLSALRILRQDNPHVSLFAGLQFLFFFNDTATTEIYTLSLHDALPISLLFLPLFVWLGPVWLIFYWFVIFFGDRKSTRLNSSHVRISYAVFCLKKITLPQPRAPRLNLTLTWRIHFAAGYQRC